MDHSGSHRRGPASSVADLAIRETLPHTLINPHALSVIRKLTEAGYCARLVGGGVRDLLLGREPKDFDVVTNAHPDDIRRVFRNARLIGRRFRLAHVYFGRDVIEVATYRGTPNAGGQGAENFSGTEPEDAHRRDFTINALYYDVAEDRVYDYVGGLDDLRRGVLRMIGPVTERFEEDPVRMLRAVRFAAKLGLKLDPSITAALPRFAPLLTDVPPARLFEEVLKLFQGGYAAETYEMLRQYHLFGPLFPDTEDVLASEVDGFPQVLVARALASTDERIRAGKPVTPAFLFAALLWPPYVRELAIRSGDAPPTLQATSDAGEAVFRAAQSRVAIPRRFSGPAREIWGLQARAERRQGRQAFRLLEHKRFRAAYDFLVLRAETDPALASLAAWWTDFQAADESGREALVAGLVAERGAAPRRRRRRRRSRSE